MSSWRAGAARREVTVWEEGIHLFGWGIPTNVAHGAATPMYARAFVVDDGRTPLAFVVLDVGVITLTLRRHVLQELRSRHPECPIEDAHILLTATHTHSGPSGYSEYLFYGFSGPGLSKKVVDTYARGAADAIAAAWRERVDAELHFGTADMPLSTPVAFNRSLQPHLRNEELRETAPPSAEEATYRRMTLLRMTRKTDRSPIGVLSWFATHATSVHSDNTKIHGDNRGLAAEAMETELRERYGREVITAFAQEAAGDVTPNFRWDACRKLVIGAHDDDADSAHYVANALRRLAGDILRDEDALQALTPVTAGELRYVHLARLHIDTPGGNEAPIQLGDAVMGLGFMEGTREGPGPFHGLRRIARTATTWLRETRGGRGRELRANQGNKLPFLDTGEGRMGKAFGLLPLLHPRVPGFIDPSVATYKRYVRAGAVDDLPWTPTVLPFQVLRLGQLWISTIPGEPTTMAGMRLRAAISEAVASAGDRAEHTVIAGYSNDYAAYVTTREEYFEQWYEGASTMFGPETFRAMRWIVKELAGQVAGSRIDRIPTEEPPLFDERLFDKRDFASALAPSR